MFNIQMLVEKFDQAKANLAREVRDNGGKPMAFVLTMLVLNGALIIAGAALYVLGDPRLIEAAGRAAIIITPSITVATVILGFVRKPAQLQPQPQPQPLG